jgi:FixJ family two-component response regulator
MDFEIEGHPGARFEMSMAVDQMQWMSLKGARILVVDDDAQAVRALDQVLTKAGAEVETAMSVRSALERLGRSDRFDAAVVDFFLVGQLGKALIRPLREHLVSTLMISGVERVDVANQAITAGADDFMLKPFEIEDFLDVVARLVDKTRQWRDKISHIRLGVRPDRRQRPATGLDEQIDDVVEVVAETGKLTGREKKVVRLVVDSLTNDQIAAKLGISLSTVKYHDKKARKKLGVDSRDELRQIVMRLVRGRRES